MDLHNNSKPDRLGLYPAIPPNKSGWMAVSKQHNIYFEECGNPYGLPVLIVHGGPGGGSNPTMRRYHDPEKYRIILFDQRGCGRSTPHAELSENTTWDLVEDIEKLRQHIGINRWQLFGGSWGSTLSLIYAICYPAHVSSLILRGIFLLRKSEIRWFYQEGCNWLFPDVYEQFKNLIPPDEREDMVAAYYRRLTCDDREIQLKAAKSWTAWEASVLTLLANSDRIKNLPSAKYALAFARIECHYFYNNGFLTEDNWILNNIYTIKHLPCTIVHGRYDVVTPIQNAWSLKEVWPQANLNIVPDAGHAMSEPGNRHELITATKRHEQYS